MSITTRAAIAPGLNEPLLVEEVQLRTPEGREVLVQMKASGLCHTDLSVMEGKFPIELPAILGHEGAGIVVECGPDVTLVRPGDHVVLNNTPHCGECSPCLSGKTSFCIKMIEDAGRPSPFTWRGKPLRSMGACATFSAHTVILEDRLTTIDASVPLESAALVPCGVMTGTGAALNVAKVEAGSSVLVFGLGSIGLSVLQASAIAGAKTIIALDLNPAKEAVARQFGATHFINPSIEPESVNAQVKAILGGTADYAFDCVGHPAIVAQAIALVSPYWGTVVAVGITPADQNLTIPASAFYFGRTLRGTLIGDWNPQAGTRQIIDWYQQGKLKIDELITHRIALDDINAGFDLMKSGVPIRTVICY